MTQVNDTTLDKRTDYTLVDDKWDVEYKGPYLGSTEIGHFFDTVDGEDHTYILFQLDNTMLVDHDVVRSIQQDPDYPKRISPNFEEESERIQDDYVSGWAKGRESLFRRNVIHSLTQLGKKL